MSNDPTLPRYGDLIIRGTTLDEFAPVVTSRLSGSWSRAIDIEESWRERQPAGDHPLVFRHEADGRLPSASLYLFARRNGDLYVSNVVPAETGRLTEEKYNGLLRDFYVTAVKPAASELGAEAELDVAEYDLAERAGAGVRDALVRFSRAANKSTGASHPMDADRFNDFIIEVSRLEPDARPGSDTLAEWLVADGWSEDTAWDLAIQFEQGLSLLDRASSHG